MVRFEPEDLPGNVLAVPRILVLGLDFPRLTLKLAYTVVSVSLDTPDRREQCFRMRLSSYHSHIDMFTHRFEVKLCDTGNLFQLLSNVCQIKSTVPSVESNVHSLVRSLALARIQNKSEGNNKGQEKEMQHKPSGAADDKGGHNAVKVVEWMLDAQLDAVLNFQIHKVIWNVNERGV